MVCSFVVRLMVEFMEGRYCLERCRVDACIWVDGECGDGGRFGREKEKEGNRRGIWGGLSMGWMLILCVGGVSLALEGHRDAACHQRTFEICSFTTTISRAETGTSMDKPLLSLFLNSVPKSCFRVLL